jgi:hypothetical protein
MTLKNRSFGLGFEPLEPRTVPTAFGIPWADPGHMTLSFAPDGTPTPLGSSSLTRTLGSAGSDWQREVLRGFQTWAALTNINIGVVRDGGQSFGASGAVQGDNRFGDIRIAAVPLGDDALASSSPFNWTGTTLNGDVLFNSHESFRIGSTANTYDIYSIALHEAGHVFGLDHTDRADSVLGEAYAYRTGVYASDVAAIRAIYGTRSPDANEGVWGNNTPARATSLRPSGLSGRVVGGGDLTTLSDVDFYTFSTLPTLGLTSVTVKLQAAGLSLVTPRVTVYNSAGKIVAQGVSTNPLNNDVSLKFTNAFFGGTYTVKVEGANDDVFGIGQYHLTVDTLNLTVPIPVVSSLLSPIADGFLNDTLANATNLTKLTSSQTDQRFDATYRGMIESRVDQDVYKIKAPASGNPDQLSLNVIVWATGSNSVDPRVRVYDAAGNPVRYRVLANDSGLFSIEVSAVVPDSIYYVSVAARNPNGANATGGYFLGADFNEFEKTTFTGLGSGSVAPTSGQTATFQVTSAGVFQFALAATGVTAGSGVQMILQDASGRVVFTLDATANQPLVTNTKYLAAGTYTIRYFSRNTTSAPVFFDLFLLKLSDDVGPYSTKTTRPSSGTSGSGTTTGGTGYSYDSSSSPRPAGQPYYF